MSTITENYPRIKIIEYRQDETDKFYGTCLWARFYFDLDNYSLTIESDCGNYGYSWRPTPETERFLKLCCRFDEYYLCEKFSNRSVIDQEKTYANLVGLIKDLYLDDEIIKYEKDYEEDLYEELKDAVFSYTDARELIEAVEWRIRNTLLENHLESYDIYECIDKDYPINVKTITKIFVTEIIPYLKEQLSKNFIRECQC